MNELDFACEKILDRVLNVLRKQSDKCALKYQWVYLDRGRCDIPSPHGAIAHSDTDILPLCFLIFSNSFYTPLDY